MSLQSLSVEELEALVPPDLLKLFLRLKRSSFRAKFALSARDREYMNARTPEGMTRHARELLRTRVGAAQPRNDGKQTPYRGHPVFTAQHATGTCCRGCIEKWHGIPRGHQLSEAELDRLVEVVAGWLALP